MVEPKDCPLNSRLAMGVVNGDETPGVQVVYPVQPGAAGTNYVPLFEWRNCGLVFPDGFDARRTHGKTPVFRCGDFIGMTTSQQLGPTGVTVSIRLDT